MDSGTRSKKLARTVRLFTLAAVGIGAGACAAVLGIDDRELIGDGGTTEAGGDGPNGGDGSSIDGPVSLDGGIFDSSTKDSAIVIDASGRVCDPTQCANSGGTCNAATNSCTFKCTSTSCNNTTVICPVGNDCVVDCSVGASCDGVKCRGGNSCLLECSGAMACKNGVSCESNWCEIQCTAESCKSAVPISCDASVCIANCAGDKSCDKGVDFHASDYCGITCSGSPSCNASGAPVRCVAPDASITCTNVANTCQAGKPQCGFTGADGYCAITCGNTSSCGSDYCCDGGTCTYAGNAARNNKCP